MAYKKRDKFIKLHCQHQYHKDCITRWLRFNKVCTSDIPCAICAAVSVHHKRLHSSCSIALRLLCSVYHTVLASFEQLGCSS
ncbi:unnamed protein product [Musa acuminata var. zebrina]